ncbi:MULTISPECIES: DUF262 domain-containing protein [Acinetobacter calcoaceticus/baumannii complex]|uniref:DUF262 domain-containing protein n=6 Tax=Acinetobacter TaxID=469 RepID=A0A6L8M3D5_ACIBA|nr:MULTISPECIES: DUF262 domain-containing protein [Acinetobacter calcoaceticus/baumannii complex]ELW81597.1 PF03235 family protein [Acinetobacter sp. OIFC021]EXE52027.1 hypothetical protein J576_0654 [Acinetobacter sp. 766875]MBF6953396.1 DUF262 domain-containing protein [Acinetobacter baumannii]MCE5996178.1 DUF262 domain-containing protein [Acinetobacter nosocomialis]MCH2008299.1 DUF262 domain-containing protein [Acinetobacter nosocomialis]
MKNNFVHQLRTLPEIFEGNFFCIPDYQRGYAWDEKQIDELLKDIDHLLLDTSAVRHYTGTLVLSLNKDQSNQYHIVDGQQRLTTLVIFLKCISLFADREDKESIGTKYLKRGDIGNDQFVLKLNLDTNKFFEKVILSDRNLENCPITLESHERLLNAHDLIHKWLTQKTSSGVLITQILNVLEERLGFLVYSPVEDAETGIMFEVINNRGKQLSELEKVKNYLIYCSIKLSAFSLRDDITEHWSDILQSLNKAKKTSPNEESSFLRYCLVVFFKMNKTDSQYGYDVLKERIKIDQCLQSSEKKNQTITKLQDFIQFLKLSAKWYEHLYAPNYVGLDKAIQPLIENIRAQNVHASIMPLFLALVLKNKGKGEMLERHLQLLETLNFRVYIANGMTFRKDTGQGDLYQYASRYYYGNLLNSFIAEENRVVGKTTLTNDDQALEYLLVSFTQNLAHDGWFEASFYLDGKSSFDFYGWRGLRYFLMNYESSLQPNKTINIDKILKSRSSGKTNDYLSVEHLWATENRNFEGQNCREVDRYQKRRLGNFVLLELRLNIQGTNDDAWIKADRYLEGFEQEAPTDLYHVRLAGKSVRKTFNTMSDVKKTINYYSDFYSEIIGEQEERYIKFAMKRWSLKGYIGYKKHHEELEN